MGDYFLQFNFKYFRDKRIEIWLKLKLKLQDREDAMKLVKTWAELQPMTYDYLNEKIDTFEDNYPLEIESKPLLLLLIVVTMVIIIVMTHVKSEGENRDRGGHYHQPSKK